MKNAEVIGRTKKDIGRIHSKSHVVIHTSDSLKYLLESNEFKIIEQKYVKDIWKSRKRKLFGVFYLLYNELSSMIIIAARLE